MRCHEEMPFYSAPTKHFLALLLMDVQSCRVAINDRQVSLSVAIRVTTVYALLLPYYCSAGILLRCQTYLDVHAPLLPLFAIGQGSFCSGGRAVVASSVRGILPFTVRQILVETAAKAPAGGQDRHGGLVAECRR